jgi:membrane protein
VVSLVVNASIVAFGQFLFGTEEWTWITWFTQFPVSLFVTSSLFGLIFKTLPDATIRWIDVAVGALTAGLLFTVGKFLIGFYLARTTLVSSYGAAGTFILLLLWVYYSTLIFLYGAEIARIRRDRRQYRAATERFA